MPYKLGTEYYQLHAPWGEPTGVYFRIHRDATGLDVDRFNGRTRQWEPDAEMLDYYYGYESGAEEVTKDQVRAAGIPL